MTGDTVWRILQMGSFLVKNGQKTGTFSDRKRAKTNEILIYLEKKWALLGLNFPFFLAVFTVLQVYPKTRLSITWPKEPLLL